MSGRLITGSAEAPRAGADRVAIPDLPHRPGAASLRWSVLIGELVRMAQILPRTAPPTRWRRIGEPALPRTEPSTDHALLDAAAGHALGVLSRCCALDRLPPLCPAGHGTPDSDELEARIMLATTDHLLGRRLDWAGREAWRRRPLATRLLGAASIDKAARTALHARLAAGDPRFTAVLPALLGLGLGGDLFPDQRTRLLLPLLPSPPETLSSASNRPNAAPHVAGRSRQRAALLFAGLLATVGLAVWQNLVWHDATLRVAAHLAWPG